MPVEQREAGRWKRERQKSGTNTVGSAREGSTRWRDPRPMGMDGTGRLDGTHVGILARGWLVLLKTGACCGLPIFFEVTTNWRAGCQKLACPVRREGRPESSSLPLSNAWERVSEVRHAQTPIRLPLLGARAWRYLSLNMSSLFGV